MMGCYYLTALKASLSLSPSQLSVHHTRPLTAKVSAFPPPFSHTLLPSAVGKASPSSVFVIPFDAALPHLLPSFPMLIPYLWEPYL